MSKLSKLKAQHGSVADDGTSSSGSSASRARGKARSYKKNGSSGGVKARDLAFSKNAPEGVQFVDAPYAELNERKTAVAQARKAVEHMGVEFPQTGLSLYADNPNKLYYPYIDKNEQVEPTIPAVHGFLQKKGGLAGIDENTFAEAVSSASGIALDDMPALGATALKMGQANSMMAEPAIMGQVSAGERMGQNLGAMLKSERLEDRAAAANYMGLQGEEAAKMNQWNTAAAGDGVIRRDMNPLDLPPWANDFAWGALLAGAGGAGAAIGTAHSLSQQGQQQLNPVAYAAHMQAMNAY